MESDIIDRVMRFLESTTMKDVLGYCGKGNVSEPLVHTFAAEYGLPNINRLSSSQYNDTDANSLLRSFALPDDYELQCNGAVFKLPTVSDDISTVKIEKEIYYQLKKRNVPSIDSFFIIDNDVFYRNFLILSIKLLQT